MTNILSISDYLSFGEQTLAVLIVTAVCCAIIGNFLVLRKLSMLTDALSHTVLLGIVLAFFMTRNLDSPFLVIGASIFGIITVFSIESLGKTGLVEMDDAVGIIFPLFFSIAVILITKFARNVHIDTDVVLMGEVILAPLNTIKLGSITMPKSFLYMSIMLLVNLSFVVIFFKELKITTFDKEFASIIGFSSSILFYVLMTLTSFTAVSAFDAVGAILVISFIVTPAASAYLISKDLRHMIAISIVYAILNSVLGYYLSIYYNVSTSGMTASIAGITFFLTFLLNRKGLITQVILREAKRRSFNLEMLIIHLGNHMYTDEAKDELGIESIYKHLNWKQSDIDKRINTLINKAYVFIDEENHMYKLTDHGLEKYRNIKENYGI